MKNYIVLMLISIGLQELKAQVVLNLQLPSAGLTVKSQLWNLSVINTQSQPMQVQIELSMINTANNQTVLTATTRTIDLPKGLKQLRSVEVSPVVYNIQGGGVNVDLGPDGFLPVGSYQLCYSVIRLDLEVSERIAEQCESVLIEPISPPQLVNPADSEAIDFPRPLFNWLPPSPVQLFTNLSYDFNLVEVQTLQTGPDALQQNIPIQTQSNLNRTSLQYPLSMPSLDTGKLYAWQVTARSGGTEVARSEVWTFRVKKEIRDSIKIPLVSYYKMKKENDAGYMLTNGIVYYEYENEWNDKTVSLSVYDISQTGQKPLALDSSYINMHIGQNLNKLDFTGDKILQDKHLYVLDLVNSRQEHWYIKFLYRQAN